MTGRIHSFAVMLVVVVVVAGGCSGGFGPTLPSPDGSGNDVICPGADLTGIVRAPTGDVVENAFVAATDGNVVKTARTAADGRYCIDGLQPGDLIVSFGVEGWATEYEVVEGFTGASQMVLGKTMRTSVESNPTECPTVLSMFASNPVLGDNAIVGSATNTDANRFGFFANGKAQLGTFEDMVFNTAVPAAAVDAKSFRIPVTLAEGANRWRLFVANANCAVLGEPLSVNIGGGGVGDTLCVRITERGGGNACNVPVVAASDGTTLWTNQEVVNGSHCFVDIGTGSLGIAVGRPGWMTAFDTVDYPGGAQTMPMELRLRTEDNPTEFPVVSLAVENVNHQTQTATITGSATNVDGIHYILFHNGSPSVKEYVRVPGQSGLPNAIKERVSLVPGENRFTVMVSNAWCVVLSDEATVAGGLLPG